jgi:hypothetical protein
LQFNYLSLKQENKVGEFLQYYPEHTVMFNKFKLALYYYTSNLFMNYISCFIRKEKPLKEYEFEYKSHMYKLHEKYKTELKPQSKIIDKKYVIDYVNALHPAQQMFIINYKHMPSPTPIIEGAQTMSFDTSVTSANVCPNSIISEESCKISMED